MSKQAQDAPRFTNRLAREKSPYLLQHAHNPVDWYAWGPEALETAQRENKPIFLSVGYSACHWCHVMERESFENEGTAKLLNEHFVCIKVDREERPDIDEIYMTAVQMMTGHGGWPMSVFLTPDGRPFYGGTYYPPTNTQGRIGFPSLITQLADAYKNRPDEIEQVAGSMSAELQKATRQRPLSAPAGPLDASALLAGAVAELQSRFDAETGGFGIAPKFPPHHSLRLLLTALRRGEPAETMLLVTLEKMALGGVYDHIGGGFHRYATDAIWLLPHFEKMLYDNALLARVYAEASEITGRVAYARIARETCDWVLREMTDAGGGFHSALDADSEGEEGKYYVWTPEEVEQVLGAGWSKFCARYNIVPGGNFRDEATRQKTGASIPHLAVGASEITLPDALTSDEESAREKLRAVRLQRVPPGKDDKVITSWNGLMIGALAYCGKVLNEPRYIEAAKTAANFCLTTLRPNGELLRRYARGESAISAFLDDYAYLADGLLELHDATGDTRWFTEARGLVDTLLANFWDTEDAGFFFAGTGHETLIARSKDLFDGALPSANGVAARVLARLAPLPQGEPYREKVRALLHAYHGVLHRAPQGSATLILAALDAFADTDAPAELVMLTTGDATLNLTPGQTAEIMFTLNIAPGWHINARNPTRDFLIPTVATIASDAPAALGPVRYPSATLWAGDGDVLSVYKDMAVFVVPVTVPADALKGTYRLALSVRYQPCGETACLPPTERTVGIAVTIE